VFDCLAAGPQDRVNVRRNHESLATQRFCRTSALQLGEAPDPIPAAGEALLRVMFAGLNPADRYLSEGQYPAKPPLPHILGRDGIGIVEKLGAGVTQFKIGDKAKPSCAARSA